MHYNIKTLAKKLRDKEFSAVELAIEYLDKTKKANGKTNAVIAMKEETTLSQAKKADAMIAKGNAPLLAGIPMNLKDSIITKDMPTSACSKMLSTYKPSFNATAYEKLLQNGAVLLGKTNMDEFSMGSSTLNGIYGECSNPYDNARTAGGSSGGSAASVATLSTVYSLGADSGGSIRQPAAFCGVAGFKPSYGAVSRNGLIALGSSFEQIGPMTNSVSDARIVFDVIRGADPFDHTSMDIGKTSIAKPVIGIDFKSIGKLADNETAKVFESAIDAAKKLGYEIKEINPKLFWELPKLYMILAYSEIASNMGRFTGIDFGYATKSPYINTDDYMRKTRSEAFSEDVKARIMFGNFVVTGDNMAKYFDKAMLLRKDVVDEYARILSECDMLLSPSTPIAAYEKSHEFGSIEEEKLSDMFALPANFAGLPSISIPFGSTKEGLPVGIMLTGRKGEDFALLDIAEKFEARSAHRPLKA